jgi:16S rRNA (guanine966-N2)-methyltransferase
MDAFKWLRMQSQIDYDVLFIDPPFDSPSLLFDALKILGEFHKKTLRTIMYVESPVRLENAAILNDLQGWSIERQLVAGAVKASLLKQLVKE